MKYFCDGFVLGQNGSSKGGGYTIVDESNNLIVHETIYKDNFTNNDGELLGVYETLKLCKPFDTISTDSMVALSWIRSMKVKARPDLKPLAIECNFLLKDKCINLMWEGRDYNLAGIYNENKGK